MINRYKLVLYGLFILLSSFICTSCGVMEMADVSSDPKYSKIIGMKLKLKEDLLALGISLADIPRNKPADFVLLVRKPGIGGRWVVSESKLKKGTVVQVVSVQRPKHSLDKFLSQLIGNHKGVYVVKEINSNQLGGQTIHIDLIGEDNDQIYGFDAYEVVSYGR